LTSQALKTLQGDSLSVMSAGPAVVGKAQVVMADIKASNGVIHVIDKVLMPKLPAPAPESNAAGVIELAIQRGVPLFNSGKPEACAAVYEITAQSLLAGHSQALGDSACKRLREALVRIEKSSNPTSNAWTLRRALDNAYRSLKRNSTR